MKYYVLKYANGSLVGIDVDSGGYPYEAYSESDSRTSLNGVVMYQYNDFGRKNALEYNRRMNNVFKLAVLECTISVIDK